MKNTCAFFGILILVASPLVSHSQTESTQSKTDRDQYDLVGPVETLRYEWAQLASRPNRRGEFKELERIHVRTVTFDVNGKLVLLDPPRYKCGMSWADGLGKRFPTYDSEGRVVEEISFDYRGLFSGRSTFKYDDWGNRIESAYYGSNGLMWVRKSDSKRKLIERSSYNGDGSLDFREVYTRNEKGNVTEVLTYDGAGSLTQREISEYEYDERGNWVKSIDRECDVAAAESPCKPTRVDYQFITYHSEKDD